jgi:phosphoserine phosphatase RsbU/P
MNEPAAARILVADDHEMNRDLLSRRLRRQGHEVEVAVNGREALEMMEASPFDLLLLDIMMPELDGYGTLERMRAHEVLRHVPVIMVSALDDVDAVVRCIELGAEDHLPKPFNPVILRARVGACLEKKRLRDRERLYARSLEREMDIGREIQAGFLPAVLPAPEGWELAVRFRPARQVAGDFYDAFALPGGRGTALVVADVCDKGVGAALFMALCRSLLRAVSEQAWAAADGRADGEVLHEVVAFVNDYVARTHGAANMFATVFFGVLDPATGALVYVNGGHDAPAIAAAGAVRARLEPTGPAVGMFPELPFGIGEARLDPGEALLLFTDGASDARDAAGAVFGEERLLALACAGDPSPGAMLERIDAALAEHAAGADPFDDVTLLAVRRR